MLLLLRILNRKDLLHRLPFRRNLEALPVAHSSPVEELLVELSSREDYELEASCLKLRAYLNFWVRQTLTFQLLNF